MAVGCSPEPYQGPDGKGQNQQVTEETKIQNAASAMCEYFITCDDRFATLSQVECEVIANTKLSELLQDARDAYDPSDECLGASLDLQSCLYEGTGCYDYAGVNGCDSQMVRVDELCDDYGYHDEILGGPEPL